MLYLVESTNSRDISSFLAEETERVTELLTARTIVHCWLKADASGAVMVLDCANETTTTEVLSTFPSAIHGATDFEVTPITELGTAT